MAKTLIEIDDEYLAAAQRPLGTATKKDTGQPMQWVVARGTVP